MKQEIRNLMKKVLFCLMFLFISVKNIANAAINNIPERNPYFTGRELYLKEIQKNLKLYKTIYLTGYGGIGKTQLAKEYVYLNQEKYDLVWWFDSEKDLKQQYENLLIHLSSYNVFKNILKINTNKLAPDVMVDFTNTLLSQCNCKWLLIYDNVKKLNKIQMPYTKNDGHNIIITSREKPDYREGVIETRPFTEQEGIMFLSKIFPKESKEDIVKLEERLCHYPLALAQISEEIHRYDISINTYLENSNIYGTKTTPASSDITQKYHIGTYSEILNFTLQSIERSNKEAAKILYMLSLLKINIDRKVAVDIFGREIEEKLIFLSKHGVIHVQAQEQTAIIYIHDVIREGAIRRLNNLGDREKKEIIYDLAKYFGSFYKAKNFLYINDMDNRYCYREILYKYIEIILEQNLINADVINAQIVGLKLNNVLFNKYASFVLYQQLSNKIYEKMYSKSMNKIVPKQKILLYANMVLSGSITASLENVRKFEKEYLYLLSLAEFKLTCDDLFFVYTQLAHFYITIGNLMEAKNKLIKAEKLLPFVDDNLCLLQYWYVKARHSHEVKDMDVGIKAVDSLDKYPASRQAIFAARNLRIKFELFLNHEEKAKIMLEETIKEASEYYNNNPTPTMGELEFTKACVYLQCKQYALAKKQLERAQFILLRAYGYDLTGDLIDITQANVYIKQGELYMAQGNYNLAIHKYNKAIKFYNKPCYGGTPGIYRYGEALANLCFIYYKQKDFYSSMMYYKKLIFIFGLEHRIVEELIKKLPKDYLLQIRNKAER